LLFPAFKPYQNDNPPSGMEGFFWAVIFCQWPYFFAKPVAVRVSNLLTSKTVNGYRIWHLPVNEKNAETYYIKTQEHSAVLPAGFLLPANRSNRNHLPARKLNARNT
jgi:hypothetical protein